MNASVDPVAPRLRALIGQGLDAIDTPALVVDLDAMERNIAKTAALVRETGGLADTVVNYDNGDAEQGTGFVFLWETPEAVLGTIRWALDTYRFRRDAFQRMQHRAMAIDWSWETGAKTYIEVYERTLARHGG